MNSKRRKIKVKPLNDHCPFCEKKISPSYKDYKGLEVYVTDRARIMSSSRSGVCNKHQRQLAREIKRARHLALLSV